MSADEIRVDEWLEELNSVLEPEDADGVTTRELANKLGVTQHNARMALRKAIESGDWELKGKRREKGIDGRPVVIPVYGPKKRANGKKAKTSKKTRSRK